MNEVGIVIPVCNCNEEEIAVSKIRELIDAKSRWSSSWRLKNGIHGPTRIKKLLTNYRRKPSTLRSPVTFRRMSSQLLTRNARCRKYDGLK